MLEQVGQYNDLSDTLRKELETKIAGFGKRVRYKFDISHTNPDPEKKDGPIVWPFMYTLDPRTFTIIDPYENRDGKSKVKRIGMVDGQNEKGEPNKFKRVRVNGRDAGVRTFDLEQMEDIEQVMFLELHPKLAGGQFADKTKNQICSRVDEKKYANDQRQERTSRLKALNAAQAMSEKEVLQFVDAMQWDNTEEIEILRERIEALAETDFVYFNDVVDGKALEYMSTIKRGLDRKLIAFDPADYKFIWVGNNQPIAVLSPIGEKTEVQKMADWFATAGQKADEAYKRLKNLTDKN